MGVENLTHEQELERRRKISVRAVKHGHRIAPKGSPEYRTWVAWCSMRARCENVRCEDYPRYGGRGISVCTSWLEKYENFLSDMGLCPFGYSLDRIHNDSGYFKDNCRWATKKTQNNNRRSNRVLDVCGESMTLAAFCEKYDFCKSTVRLQLGDSNTVDNDLIFLLTCKRRGSRVSKRALLDRVAEEMRAKYARKKVAVSTFADNTLGG